MVQIFRSPRIFYFSSRNKLRHSSHALKCGDFWLNIINIKLDKTPPILELNVSPTTLWPPNKKAVDVFVKGSAYDALSGLKETKFYVIDEYKEISPVITDFNQSIKLIAWRNGNDFDGRNYTIKTKAFDNAGNFAEKETKVIVPHDMNKK